MSILFSYLTLKVHDGTDHYFDYIMYILYVSQPILR